MLDVAILDGLQRILPAVIRWNDLNGDNIDNQIWGDNEDQSNFDSIEASLLNMAYQAEQRAHLLAQHAIEFQRSHSSDEIAQLFEGLVDDCVLALDMIISLRPHGSHCPVRKCLGRAWGILNSAGLLNGRA